MSNEIFALVGRYFRSVVFVVLGIPFHMLMLRKYEEALRQTQPLLQVAPGQFDLASDLCRPCAFSHQRYGEDTSEP